MPETTASAIPRESSLLREDNLARHRAAAVAAIHDFHGERKSRFRAALIWSGSVAVAAVGVAYGVGLVAEVL